jgi:light-regulated signal transduction histidine kinase (bacteriophytochrome)
MVTSYVQLLKKRYEGKLDEQADEFINFAVDGVNRMRKLIEDLLLYSRVSSKKLKLEEIDCNEIISSIVAEINKRYKLKNHAVTFSKLPIIKADKFQVRQLFYHLIENSVKFNNQKEPLVEISSQNQNNSIMFTIADNGIGIEKQYIERIFEAFQKLHHHKEYPGSGIGLTLCKKIIELHGGKIFVESEPRKGSIFRFDLPIN